MARTPRALSGKAWAILRAMRCECGLTRPVIMCQGLEPFGVHMGCGGEGGTSDAKGFFCERGFPEESGNNRQGVLAHNDRVRRSQG